MKRVGRLYPQLIDRENIRKAIINSSKRKRDRATVKRCYENQEETIDKILDILENGWRPLQPHTFVIYDSHRQKDRTISCPKYFPDQIIHHALMQVLIPVFMRGMYYHSYGSIPGRGAHAAVRNVHKWMKNDRKNTKYCLQLDISKYYHSINHVMLRHSLVLKIKDRKVLSLLFALINSYNEGERGKAIPIGYYSSQWLANFYLEPLDHFIKEKLCIKYYARYMDDMILFGRNKKELHKAKREIEKLLEYYELSLKPNWQVYRTDSRPVDFLGYKIYHDRVCLRSNTYLRLSRKVRRVLKKSRHNLKDYQSVASYKGVVEHSDCNKIYCSVRRLTKTLRKKVVMCGGTE